MVAFANASNLDQDTRVNRIIDKICPIYSKPHTNRKRRHTMEFLKLNSKKAWSRYSRIQRHFPLSSLAMNWACASLTTYERRVTSRRRRGEDEEKEEKKWDRLIVALNFKFRYCFHPFSQFVVKE